MQAKLKDVVLFVEGTTELSARVIPGRLARWLGRTRKALIGHYQDYLQQRNAWASEHPLWVDQETGQVKPKYVKEWQAYVEELMDDNVAVDLVLVPEAMLQLDKVDYSPIEMQAIDWLVEAAPAGAPAPAEAPVNGSVRQEAHG